MGLFLWSIIGTLSGVNKYSVHNSLCHTPMKRNKGWKVSVLIDDGEMPPCRETQSLNQSILPSRLRVGTTVNWPGKIPTCKFLRLKDDSKLKELCSTLSGTVSKQLWELSFLGLYQVQRAKLTIPKNHGGYKFAGATSLNTGFCKLELSVLLVGEESKF